MSKWLWIGSGVAAGGILYIATHRHPTQVATYFSGTTTTPTQSINIEGSGTSTKAATSSAPGPSGTSTRDYRINYQDPTGESANTASSGGVGGYGGGTNAREVVPTPIL